MPDIKPLVLPLTEASVRTLRAGDLVTLNGDITITAGLPTHRRIVEYMEAGRPLPIDITGDTLFHLGSYSRETEGRFEVLYMNPTTSTRFDSLMPGLIRHYRLRMVGGKGGLAMASTEAMKEVGCVYLSFLGGGCALLSDAIVSVVAVAWDDLISHYRLVRLRVADLGPLVVGIDSHGDSIFEQCSRTAEARLPEIARALDAERGRRMG
ncbi:fumarate hydratase C-terminal domain-containing protein [Rhodoplanes sp. TEM]|uniref:Fumarate hydratase C-terminal domain-containing protein n=1 Tax=Rhodoplanes tepidamans TaxID=200616 RepID=A0ABT5JIV1_RHOTP|nr:MULTISPECIES: fumarate hydratase C-terminal domain-containing protein [Rhodoplanes]MDC7789645.1 fumarate hydratase C-terminal domain-containing protein [Rhodoplanes tepidamans]MDC7985254.1 fumarate hydratase C-terminal domain-containing protein [Rhodoplanes sp. TEM]MDQ0353581.1 fumarate hydratase subunit beta [Rhodoplanes tepidamans]